MRNLEGLTSALGDEITLAGGMRSTRTTTLTATETAVAEGEADATSSDGGLTIVFDSEIAEGDIAVGQRFRLTTHVSAATVVSGAGTATGLNGTVTLSSGTFSGVNPGMRFVVDSGVAAGASAVIVRVTSTTTVEVDVPFAQAFSAADWSVLDNLVNIGARIATVTAGVAPGTIAEVELESALGADFTSESWEIVADAANDLVVESVIDWPESGKVFIDDVTYRYDARTSTTLVNLRPDRHHGLYGRIVVVPGADLDADETFTIDDGFGNVVTFAFVKTVGLAASDIRHVSVYVNDAMTANQVRTAVLEAIDVVEGLDVVAYAGTGTGEILLRHAIPGGSGWIDVVDDVADADFSTQGPRGLSTDVQPLTEVVDASRTLSAVDTYYKALTVEGGDSADLDRIGRNLGVLRPSGLLDAERWRRLIQAVAYAPKGTVLAIELALDALLGQGSWELFEDLTFASPLNHPATVYVRRRANLELTSNGKSFLDGAERVAISPGGPPWEVQLTNEPRKIVGVSLAPEPYGRYIDQTTGEDRGADRFGRLMDFGTMAESADGIEVTVSGGYATAIEPGDIFIIESGPLAGRMGTIELADGGDLMLYDPDHSLEPVLGAPIYTIATEFSGVAWRVVRPCTNARYYLPSDDESVETAGGSLVAMWTAVEDGTASEGTDVVLENDATLGRYCSIVSSDAAGALYYEHRLRVLPESSVTFEALVSVNVLSGTAGQEGQVRLAIRDGVKDIAVGFVADGTNAQIGFITTDPGHVGDRWLSVVASIDMAASEFIALRIERRGTRAVELWTRGTLLARVDYADFYTSSDTTLVFGVFPAAAPGAKLYVKSVHWAASTPENLSNWRSTTGSTTGATLTDTAETPFLATDDDAPDQKRVIITAVTEANAAGGNALGEWVIDRRVGDDEVELVGPHSVGATSQVDHAARIFVPHDPRAFCFPDVLGHDIVIESGPNAGTYTIEKVIAPEYADIAVSVDANADLTTRFGELTTEPLSLPKVYSHVIEVTPDLPSPNGDIADWHLVPDFPVDATVSFEISDAMTVTADTLTLRQEIPSTLTDGDLVEVHFTSVDSAHVEAEVAVEIQTGASGAGTGASSTDGVTVTFPAGALTDTLIHVGQTFYVYPTSVSTLRALSAPIVAVGPGDEITLGTGDGRDYAGLGDAFTELRWEVHQGPRNNRFSSTDETLLAAPFYLSDNFGYVREIVTDLAASGIVVDFDSLQRDASYDTEVEGLHVLE